MVVITHSHKCELVHNTWVKTVEGQLCTALPETLHGFSTTELPAAMAPATGTMDN